VNTKIQEALRLLALERQPEIRNFRMCAAVIHKDREIIAVGYPRRKTHPLQKAFGKNEYAIYMHAEIEALTRALKQDYDISKRDSSLYVVRVKHIDPHDDRFVFGNAKPCLGCTQFIHHSGLKKVHFTTG
jgi:deoxycytidylate deaminase